MTKYSCLDNKTNRLKTYSGAELSQISFPIGGIGSGCIGLGGDGRLIDWEIFNKPAKGSRNGHSHIAVRALKDNQVIDTRVLNSQALPPYTGTFVGNGKDVLRSFGFGIACETMPGYPNFQSNTFIGQYPFAELEFQDNRFPGSVKLTAFNPFIPLNEDDSSIPAAFFTVEFTNNSTDTITYEAAFCLRNPSKKSHNFLVEQDNYKLICLAAAEDIDDILRQGEVSLSVLGGDRRFYQENILQGKWQGDIDVYWHEFAAGREFRLNPLHPGNFDYAVVSAQVTLAANESQSVNFILSWNYPRTYNYLKPRERVIGGEETLSKPWKNYYAVLWENSTISNIYAQKNWQRLYTETKLFADSFHSQSVPQAVLEAASANLSTLKSPTVLRLEDGSFWGWEGLHADIGSCYGTCQHVWSYAYALPFLFPRLQRSIHNLSYKYNVNPAGGLIFRLLLPLGAEMYHPFRPAADAQFGEIICVYREWKLCGDLNWLRSIWPQVKKTIEYTWSADNPDRWDPDKSGVLTGRQHHTLDIELFGANSWLTGMYLTALKAASEIALTLGDNESAQEYQTICDRGRQRLADTLFNGDWFIQDIDIHDKSVLDSVPDNPDDAWYPGGINSQYWLEEYGEIKAQIGQGCLIDQCLGQWHANNCGIGQIYDSEQLRQALGSIYKHNFIQKMGDFVNSGRVFALYDESGVVICTWPKAGTRPTVPVYYHSESMYGFEYAVAALMIQSGLVSQGLEIVAKGRARFDGIKRNPWNEFECGSNYARSMASYSLLNAYFGLVFDLHNKILKLNPVEPGDFTAFWSVDSGWGLIELADNCLTLRVMSGELVLSKLIYHGREFCFSPDLIIHDALEIMI